MVGRLGRCLENERGPLSALILRRPAGASKDEAGHRGAIQQFGWLYVRSHPPPSFEAPSGYLRMRANRRAVRLMGVLAREDLFDATLQQMPGLNI
ncbi:hypothetical protein CO671_01495 [Rhizobium sp. M10]|nr:hypothetical protein CO671_01495 [Rhizobium sp. M10]